MPKRPNENLHGSELTQGTILVLSFGVISCVAGIALGISFAGVAAILIGVGILVLAVLLCLPNLKNFIKGKQKERLIKKGLWKEEPKKTFHPGSRFDD